MGKDIAHRRTEVKFGVRKDPARNNAWLVKPSLKAFPELKAKVPKNIIFVIDISSSMSDRLPLVKNAIHAILDQLKEPDTFSAVTFSTEAQTLIPYSLANASSVSAAKNSINGMTVQASTNFHAAFSIVIANKHVIKPETSTIIFLTDGDDTCNNSIIPKQLVDLFGHFHTLPRIVPIGIKLNGHRFLSDLAALANRGSPAIYINEDNQEVYLQAFQAAFNLAKEGSKTAIQLEMTLEAKSADSYTRTEYKRNLNRLMFDGETECSEEFVFDSPVPPKTCQVRFICDGIRLHGQHQLTDQESSNVTNAPVSIPVTALKWKNDKMGSWLACFLEIGIGISLIVGSAALAMLLPYSLLVVLAISIPVALVGLGLFALGTHDLLRKTIFLPTVGDYSQPPPDESSNSINSPAQAQHYPAPLTVRQAPTKSLLKYPNYPSPLAPRLIPVSHSHPSSSSSKTCTLL